RPECTKGLGDCLTSGWDRTSLHDHFLMSRNRITARVFFRIRFSLLFSFTCPALAVYFRARVIDRPTLASLSWYNLPLGAVGTALRERGGVGFENNNGHDGGFSVKLALGVRRDPSGIVERDTHPLRLGQRRLLVYIGNEVEEGRIRYIGN
ncbi:hypothetical protein F5144DRAFT_571704, partial [Chaetomium tenue]